MRRLAIIALAATLIYPVTLLFYAAAPERAISVYLFLTGALKAAGIFAVVAFIALALFYPPFLEKFRRARQRLFSRMKTNWREVRSMEQRMAEVPTPGLALKLGNLYFDLGDHVRSAEFFERALELDNDTPLSAQFRLGVSHLNLRQPDKALSAFLAVHEREPNHAAGEVVLRIADAYHLAGDNEAARKWYEDFEKYSAGTPELYHNLALVHEAEGDRDGARRRMQQALASYLRMDLNLRRRYQLHAAQARWFLRSRWGKPTP